MPATPLDLRELLATLHRHGVEYTVIGGVAVQVHGHRRTTKDLDVIPRPDPSNLERLARALAELGAHPRELPGGGAPSAEHLASAPVVAPLSTDHGELHILHDVPGAPPYERGAARAGPRDRARRDHAGDRRPRRPHRDESARPAGPPTSATSRR